MSNQVNVPKVGEVEVCDHLACVIDLLGQKARMAEWSVMPADDVLPATMQAAICRDAGTVLAFRQLFEECFRQFNRPTIPEAMIRTLPKTRQEFYYRIRDTRLVSQQFSDTFVFSAPIQTVRRERNILPLFGALATCCATMVESLARRVPLRGGVAIGVGLELTNGNFYGPALARAHHLESMHAHHPRIIVCPETVQRLDALATGTSPVLSDDASLVEIMQRAAKGCRSFICMDQDEQWIVDYFGEAARAIYSTLPIGRQGVEQHTTAALQFAEDELRRFERARDDKHAPYYQKLCEYLRSRMSH